MRRGGHPGRGQSAGALLLTLVALARPVPAAATEGLEPVRSMGQPWRWKPYVGGSLAWDREGADRAGGGAFLGVYRDLVNPVTGVLGLAAEGYLGGLSNDWDGSVRVLAVSRALSFQLGMDWDAGDRQADLLVAVTPSLRRGGLFRTGSSFRLEWLPTRGHSLRLGLELPLEPHMGKTRPVQTDAQLPRPAPASTEEAPPLPAAAEAALAGMREAGLWLFLYSAAFDDRDDATFLASMEGFRRELARVKARLAAVDARHPEGHRHAHEVRHYHEDLDRAFVAAAGLAEGRRAAQLAREVLLDEVLVPYDRLIGRFKRPDTTRGLGDRAARTFARGLEGEGLRGARARAARAVFDRLLALVEEGRRELVGHWEGDERKGWLPLQLALRAEDTRTQAQLDALVGRVVGRPIVTGNATYPMNGARFQVELLRSILSAERYHVLWVHDFAGTVNGQPDPVTFAIAVEGYLRALTEKVRAFDATGVLPTFLVFHGQFYYETNGNRRFLTLLEDPLGHALRLPEGHEAMEARAREAQQALRAAVAGSARLQAEAQRRGEGWLRSVVKVHVSVTFPADLSFRAYRIIDAIPLAPDSLFTDHRKLAFWDLAEEEPGRGGALFSGTGVGSDYGSPSWDDRALLASGPALVHLKDEARRLLRSQGFREEDLPAPLRPRPAPRDRAEAVARRVQAGYDVPGLVAMNEVGFGRKEATLLQSVLYTLAPPDTVIVSPDSIWTSPYWAGQLVGAALRGCHVYVVAPSLGSAPAASEPLMARTREIFTRLVAAANALAPEIAAAGGTLRVGLYTRETPAGDLAGFAEEVAEGLRAQPFLLEELPLPSGALEAISRIPATLAGRGYAPSPIAPPAREGRPKLHRKTQLFASREALRRLVADPAVREAMALWLQEVARDSAASARELLRAGVSAEVLRPVPGRAVARDAGGVFYLTVGSKNQDDRGAFLDGEVTWLTAGAHALDWYLDFLSLAAATTWLEREEQVTELLPVDAERIRRLGRLLRQVL